MSKKVRTALQDRVKQQSGFFPPALAVLLLAIVGLLPEEKEPETKLVITKERVIKADQAKVTLSDGSELQVDQHGEAVGPSAIPDVVEEVGWLFANEREVFFGGSTFSREQIREWAEAVRHNIDFYPFAPYNIEPIMGVDDYGRPRRIIAWQETAPPDYDEGVEEVRALVDLYFCDNPFYKYPEYDQIQVGRSGHYVYVHGVTEIDGPYNVELAVMGRFDMFHRHVQYADPETGKFTEIVPVAARHLTQERRSMYQGRPVGNWVSAGYMASGYCTPSRGNEWTMGGRQQLRGCSCSQCRAQ